MDDPESIRITESLTVYKRDEKMNTKRKRMRRINERMRRKGSKRGSRKRSGSFFKMT